MHETAVAHSLFQTILAESQKEKARPIRAKISCGVYNVLNEDVLSFAFEAIAKDTACEGMELEVQHIPISGRCNNCSKTFDFDITSAVCSHCGSVEFELLVDQPLILETIEFETE